MATIKEKTKISQDRLCLSVSSESTSELKEHHGVPWACQHWSSPTRHSVPGVVDASRIFNMKGNLS